MIVSYSILGGVKTIGIVARILLKLNRFDDFGFLGYVTAENRSVPRAIRGLIVSPSKQLSRNTHTHTQLRKVAIRGFVVVANLWWRKRDVR